MEDCIFLILSKGLREVQTHWALPEQGVCLHPLTLMDLSRASSPILFFLQKCLGCSPHPLFPCLFLPLSLPSSVFFIHSKVGFLFIDLLACLLST